MRIQQMPFIGRQEELMQINELTQLWGNRSVICLQGAGGIGKTRLLEELYTQRQRGKIIVSEIIDFDDRALFLPENMERQIAKNLYESAFDDYIHSLVDWRKMEMANVSSEILEQQERRVQQTFFENFNKISTEQRVVLLFDTTDHLADTEVWTRLRHFLINAQNVLIILAGRNAEALYKTLKTSLAEAVHLIELQPLDLLSGQQYLQQKIELLHITLDPELAQKILILSLGKPILIDLAVEWLARTQPQSWLTELALSDLQALPDRELVERQKLFEEQLVNYLTQIRTNMDRLSLLLSRVYPLGTEMIAPLLNLDDAEAEALFLEAKSYVFVKSLPDGRISLHDEMRRMVNQYVWPEQDPSGDRRRHESQLVADYLQQEIMRLSDEYGQMTTRDGSEQMANSQISELNSFIAHEKFERDIWLMKNQQLHHTIYTDLDAGVQLFAHMFDEATKTYHLLFRNNLLAQVLDYRHEFNSEQKYVVNGRYINYLFDRGQYDEAGLLVNELLVEDILPQHRVELLIQLANLEVRLGNLENGVVRFDEAARVSAEYGLHDHWMRAINGRGWAHRNQGDFSQAIADYLQAYQLSLKLQNKSETARILNNMGFVNAYKGNQLAAMDNCKRALALWQELGDQREIGITYSTLGEIHRRFAEWSNAFDKYNQALTIFEEEDMREWISIVRAGRAAIYLHRSEIYKATADLDYADKNGPKNLRPRIIHTQAQVQMALGNLKNSRALFAHCLVVSNKMGAYEYGFRSFADLLDLAWEFGEFERWSEFLEKLEELFAGRKGEEASRLRGSSLRKIGDLAIGDNSYKAALNAYQKGFPLIAEYEQYAPYQLSAQINMTDARLHQRGQLAFINRLGHDLAEYWQTQPMLLEKTPEALITFFAWQQERDDDKEEK